MSDTGIQEVEGLLQTELEELRQGTQRSMIIAGIAVLLIGGYLVWASVQLNKLIDPEGIALAAAGAAIDAVPEASQALRGVVVDGAPEIAQAASQTIIDSLPVYRQVLEDEMAPVLDEVSRIVATTAVDALVEASSDPKNRAAIQQAASAGSEAVVARLDAIMQDAMDVPTGESGDGVTPRQTIDKSLEQLVKIDRGLKRIVKGGGDAQEREMLLAWMNLTSQWSDEANAAAEENYKVEGTP